MTPESCGYPHCRSTTIDTIWLGVPLCLRCYKRLDSVNKPGDPDKSLSTHTLDEFKRLLKITKD